MARGRSKCTWMAAEALVKAVEIIILNRVHVSPCSRYVGHSRFNLEIDELHVVRGVAEYWHRDVFLPLRLLIVWRSNSGETVTLLEQWDFQYARTMESLNDSNINELASMRSIWKKLVVVLRTIYSVLTVLPMSQLARITDVESGQGRELGSVGFAVCTRDDSNPWLLLNGHSSPAYEPNAPVDFDTAAKNEASYIALPSTKFFFGSWMVGVKYIRNAQSVLVSRNAPSAQGAIKCISNPPSGLSVLLAKIGLFPTAAVESDLNAPFGHAAANSNPDESLINVTTLLDSHRSTVGPLISSPISGSSLKKCNANVTCSPPFAALHAQSSRVPRCVNSWHGAIMHSTIPDSIFRYRGERKPSEGLPYQKSPWTFGFMSHELPTSYPRDNHSHELPPFVFDTSVNQDAGQASPHETVNNLTTWLEWNYLVGTSDF